MITERFRTLAQRSIGIDWVVEELISSGDYTYLVGEAGVGKSILMIQLVEALQSGGKFLGLNCKQRNCLYVQADTSARDWQAQVKSVAPHSSAWTMYATPSNFLDNPKYVDVVRKIVWGEYEEDSPEYKTFKGVKFDFVVFDVLNKLTAQDLNGKTGGIYVYQALKSITQKGVEEFTEDVPFILVHHPRKEGPKRGTAAGSGTGYFSNHCGQMLTLTSKNAGKTGILALEKSKVRRTREFLLDREESGAWILARDFKGTDIKYEDTFRSSLNGKQRALTEYILGE
jgi:hypothetical protein